MYHMNHILLWRRVCLDRPLESFTAIVDNRELNMVIKMILQ